MSKKVEKIILEPAKKNASQTPATLRVAAYCRVSTDTEDQRTSFDGQVKTYTSLINGNPEWTIAGIYADEGITGTSVEKRPEFMRMVADCEAGKIDCLYADGNRNDGKKWKASHSAWNSLHPWK